jgi:hypothetical protein
MRRSMQKSGKALISRYIFDKAKKQNRPAKEPVNDLVKVLLS